MCLFVHLLCDTLLSLWGGGWGQQRADLYLFPFVIGPPISRGGEEVVLDSGERRCR